MPSPPRTPIPPLRILISDHGRTRVIGPSFHHDPAGAAGAMTDNALSLRDTADTLDTRAEPDTRLARGVPDTAGATPVVSRTPGTRVTPSVPSPDPVATFPSDASPEEISAALREVQLMPAGAVEDAPTALRERLQQLCSWLAAALHTPPRPQQTPTGEPT
jgi:hypothetical protein